MPHVFVSYVREDYGSVHRLTELLKAAGIDVWLDRERISPGENWRDAIRRAVENGAFFIACFSTNYVNRQKSYANEELALAFEEIRQRPWGRRWFLPIILDSIQIPDIPISANLRLRDLQWVRFQETGWETAISKIVATITPSAEFHAISKNEDRGVMQDHSYADVRSSQLRNLLTIVVPVFNESRTIRDLVKGLKAEGFLERCQIILCDDGSTDNSYATMEELCTGIEAVTCIRNCLNSRKVGAIRRMAELVRTPFVLTLDADSMLSELRPGALEALMARMTKESYAAAYFRIRPRATNWLGRLQALDYSIFTDSLRRLLGVPLCLIGQGVLWRTSGLLNVLRVHSGKFDGDDLENTVIALGEGQNLCWERDSITLSTIPKKTIIGLLKQRALSWDYGMLRVLLGKRALQLRGESGALYKNAILMDLLGHPFRLLAIPVLLAGICYKVAFSLGSYRLSALHAYFAAARISFAYGSRAILGIWVLSIAVSAICVRGRFFSILKWAVFNAVYLASPFVYWMYYGLARNSNIDAYDILGSSAYWLGTGLLITYLWWVLVTLFLLAWSSLPREDKRELLWSVFLAPLYYFTLLVVCRTVGICKYLAMTATGLFGGSD